MAKSILYRMASGIPGDVSRMQSSIVDSPILNDSLPFTAFGLAGKNASGKFVPFAGSETAADLVGFLVRPYPTQGSDAAALLPQLAAYGPGSRLKSGYMTVKNYAGTPATGAQAYLRVGAADSTHPYGGVEATDAHTNVGAATGGNTGNGTIGTVSVTAAALIGVYTLTMLTATTFRAVDPTGNRLMDGATGTPYVAGGLTATITVGGTPMVAGDSFTVTVVRNTIPIPGLIFTGAADASGNVEVQYNI